MSKETVQKIRFNGMDFILTTPDGPDSPIATVNTYKKGECSYVYYQSAGEGTITRFHQKIGTTKDIEYGEIIEIEIDYKKAFAGLWGDSWPF